MNLKVVKDFTKRITLKKKGNAETKQEQETGKKEKERKEEKYKHFRNHETGKINEENEVVWVL